jgi:hypothetical protein
VTVACCPWCGAEYGVAATRCWDCKLALDDPPAATLAETDPDAEVGFELDEWSAADRGGLASSLGARGIDYRWEPGLVLVVRAGDEGQVDSLLDDLESDDDGEWGEGGGNESDGGRAGGDDEDDEDDDDVDDVDDVDGGERAQAAMADLFVAADRLMHGPGDERVADDLVAATAVVSASAPPYGFEPVAWLQIRELAAGVVDVLQGEGADETVMLEARSLREALRPYV